MPKAETPEPIALDVPNDPEVSQLLDKLDAFLKEGGVDTSVICAREVTMLRRLEGRPSAIPDREAWPNLLRICLHGFMPLREECGFPIVVLGGYRPNEYNAKVRGHRASRHLFGEALDLAPVTKGLSAQDAADRRLALAKAAAWLFKEHGDDHGGMGFGAYGRPAPSRIHIDFGFRRRWWNDAVFYWNLVRKETRDPQPKPTGNPEEPADDTLAKLAGKWWDDACYEPRTRPEFVRAVTTLEDELVPRTTKDWRLFEQGFMEGLALTVDGPTGSANVRLYDARGDGVSDDSEAFKKAIAHGEGLVFIPSGLYRLENL